VNLVKLSDYFRVYFSGEFMQEAIEVPLICETTNECIAAFLHTIYRYSEKYGIHPWSGDNSDYSLSDRLINMYYIADFFCFEARKNWYESIMSREFKRKIKPSK
jgi:hypothetical protein